MFKNILFSLLFLLSTAVAAENLPSQVKIKIGASISSASYDYAMLSKKHLPRFLSSNPQIETEQVSVAVGMVLLRQMVEREAADGSVLAINSNLTKYAGKADEIGFNPSAIRLVGAFGTNTGLCIARKGEKLDLYSEDTKIGAQSKVSVSYISSRIMQKSLNSKFQIITGFKNGDAIEAALIRGEVDGYCGTADMSFVLENRALSFDVVYTFGKSALLPNTADLDITPQFPPEDQDLVNYLKNNLKNWNVMYLPGSTPEPVVKAYRQAFEQMVQDENFLADVKAKRLILYATNGEEMEIFLREAYELADEIKHKLSDL